MIDRCLSAICGIALLALGSGEARAACESAEQGEGLVSTVVDARTLRLDDGREIFLAGIEIPAGSAEGAIARLNLLAAGRHVVLHGDDDRPDRYGRQPAFVFLKDSAVPLQADLLARGQALVSASISDRTCEAALKSAEATARTARQGIWASAALKNAERPDDILAGIGQFAEVEGTVLSARLAGGTFYVNFGRQWTQGFAATISRRLMPAFETAGLDLKSLKGKRVRVRGWIDRRGGPRMEIVHPGQIELVAASAVTTGTVEPEDKDR